MPANRRSTIRDVAARAGVSAATASKVLSGRPRVAPLTQAKVLRAAAELDYVANAHARALAGAGQKTIAILTHEVVTPFYALVIQGVAAQAAQTGRLCLVGTTLTVPERELSYVQLLCEQGAEAVIIAGGAYFTPKYSRQLARYVQLLDSAGTRMVLCGRPGTGRDGPVFAAHYDNEGGAYAATCHMLSAGHERILFLGGSKGFTTTEPRIAGYRRALAERGFEPMLRIGTHGAGFGYAMARRMLHSGPFPATAIVAADDGCASGAILALREAGLRVPEDVSVIGYDDVPMAAHMWPPLTSVRIPAEELGRAAVRLAIQAGPVEQREVILGTQLVIRNSVGPREEVPAGK